MNKYIGNYYLDGKLPSKQVEIILKENSLLVKFDHGEVQEWLVRDIESHPQYDQHKVYLSLFQDSKKTHLEILNQNFLMEYRARYKDQIFIENKRISTLKMTFKWVLFLLGILGFSFFLYTAIIPILVDRTTASIPFSWEQKMGEPIFENILLTENIDSSKSGILDSFFQELQWDRLCPTHVYISNSSVVNAFALPGGKIIVYQGLLDKMESYPELVALLGHEYGHIEKRHVFRGVVQSMSTLALLSFIIGDMSGVSAAIMEQANQLYNLKYSRAYEAESDAFSLEKMVQRSVDPDGMLSLFKRLKDSTDSSLVSSVPDFLSSHPGIDDRIEIIKSKIEKNMQTFNDDLKLKDLFLRLKNKN